MNVMIINQYASNKGDRAVLYFLVRELKRNNVRNICISTHDRKWWADSGIASESGVKFVPWGLNAERPANSGVFLRKMLGIRDRLEPVRYGLGRNILFKYRKAPGLKELVCNGEFLRAVNAADLVVSTGGHHVTTLLSPDAISGQLFDMGIVHMAGKPLVLWSQSIGPLEFRCPENADFVRSVLSEASEIFVRDDHSSELMDNFGVRCCGVRQTFESVIGLNDLFPGYKNPSDREKILGIAIYAAQARAAADHTTYVNDISALADHAIQKGYTVHFFPMELKDGGSDDRPLIREIAGRIKDTARCIVEDRDMDTAEHLAKVARCRVFAGHKTHSVIFALAAGTPLIALAYHKKTEDFMAQYGLSRYAIADREISANRLCNCFDNLNTELDTVGRLEFEKSREYGQIVRNDFSDMVKRYAHA